MVKVKVIFDYDAAQEDELTIKKDDIISDVKKQPGGWWEGILNGRRGVFPDNFVEDYTPPPSSEPMKGPKPGAGSNVSDLRNRIGGNIRAGPPPPTKTGGGSLGGGKSKQMAAVLFEYKPEQPDELELNEGDEVEIVRMAEEGWWEGVLRGKTGMFPSNFVKLIETAHVAAPSPASAGYAPGAPKHNDNNMVAKGNTGGRPPAAEVHKKAMPPPPVEPASPPLLPERNRVSDSDGLSFADNTDGEPMPYVEAQRKRLKTKAERNQLIQHNQVAYSSSDNLSSVPNRSRHRHRRKPKVVENGDQKSSTQQKVTLPSVWSTWSQEIPVTQIVNKAKSLGTERDIKTSSVSIKNKESSPAKLAASPAARTSPLAKRPRSKSSTNRESTKKSTAVPKKATVSEKKARSKSRTDEHGQRRSSSKTQKQDILTHQRVAKLQDAENKSSPKAESKTKATKPVKKRSRRNQVKKSKENVGPIPANRVGKGKSSDRTLDNIPSLVDDIVVDVKKKTAAGKDKTKPTAQVLKMKSKYEQKVGTVPNKSAEKVHWSVPSASHRLITPLSSDFTSADDIKGSNDLSMSKLANTSKSQPLPTMVQDLAVQCDNMRAKEDTAAVKQLEAKLSTIEQAVIDIRSNVSNLTALVETIKSVRSTTFNESSTDAINSAVSPSRIETVSDELEDIRHSLVLMKESSKPEKEVEIEAAPENTSSAHGSVDVNQNDNSKLPFYVNNMENQDFSKLVPQMYPFQYSHPSGFVALDSSNYFGHPSFVPYSHIGPVGYFDVSINSDSDASSESASNVRLTELTESQAIALENELNKRDSPDAIEVPINQEENDLKETSKISIGDNFMDLGKAVSDVAGQKSGDPELCLSVSELSSATTLPNVADVSILEIPEQGISSNIEIEADMNRSEQTINVQNKGVKEDTINIVEALVPPLGEVRLDPNAILDKLKEYTDGAGPKSTKSMESSTSIGMETDMDNLKLKVDDIELSKKKSSSISKHKSWTASVSGYKRFDNDTEAEIEIPGALNNSSTVEEPTLEKQLVLSTDNGLNPPTINNTVLSPVAKEDNSFMDRSNREEASTLVVLDGLLAHSEISIPGQAFDQTSLTDDSEISVLHPDDIQLPTHSEKKKHSFKSKLAKAFGFRKKKISLNDKHSTNSSIDDIDALFDHLPPPTRITKRSTWSHKKTKNDSDKISSSSMPQHPPPPPPKLSRMSLKSGFGSHKKKSQTSQMSEAEHKAAIQEQLTSLLEEC